MQKTFDKVNLVVLFKKLSRDIPLHMIRLLFDLYCMSDFLCACSGMVVGLNNLDLFHIMGLSKVVFYIPSIILYLY